jgi:hypothetical protein
MELNLLTKKKVKMMQTFTNILATLENSKNLEVKNQAFENEIIVDQELSISVLCNLKFSNFNFLNVISLIANLKIVSLIKRYFGNVNLQTLLSTTVV